MYCRCAHSYKATYLLVSKDYSRRWRIYNYIIHIISDTIIKARHIPYKASNMECSMNKNIFGMTIIYIAIVCFTN